jgi:hypothetical protein
VVGLAATEGRRRRADGAVAWAEAAAELNGQAGRTPHEGLRASVGGVAVRAAVVDHLGARRRHTRIWAQARVRPGPRLALGTRRRRLQSIALDPSTTAWTDRPRHVASRWAAADTERWRRIRGAHESDGGCRLVSDGHTVELVVDEVVTDAARVVAAVELVGRIAGDDVGAVAAFGGLTGATPVPGALAVRVAPGDFLVEVDEQTSATVISGSAPVGSAPVRVRAGGDITRAKAAWATPVVAAAFAASGAQSLVVSLGESRLAWAKLELDLERLRAGLVVVRAVAGDASTPYR